MGGSVLPMRRATARMRRQERPALVKRGWQGVGKAGRAGRAGRAGKAGKARQSEQASQAKAKHIATNNKGVLASILGVSHGRCLRRFFPQKMNVPNF